jgi:PIN domain nuclease of toxin-antitoxin system
MNNAASTAKKTLNEKRRAMAVVLDAQGLEAFLRDEFAAELVEQLIFSGEQMVMATINLAETVDRMRRVHGVVSDSLHADLLETGIHFSAVDTELAVEAAELRAAHYHRTRRSVSLADCTAAALALDRGARLATSDPALLALMIDEGGMIEALPASDGTVWAPPARR